MSTYGRYTLVRRVGIGGMAEIWKAKATGPAGFEKVLAIKKVLPHLAEDAEFIEMFVAEAKLVATLVHPNIVQVFDFGQVGKDDYFIAMEYVAGSNLAQIVRRLGEKKARIPVEVALYIALEASRGLGYAHSQPSAIVHRDVSPQNIVVSFGGEVKVTDFGIAKVESALPRTDQGHVRGKLAYMSPEQSRTRALDGRSDLFSLGVVLFELVTGKRLFSGSSSEEIYAKLDAFTGLPGGASDGLPVEVVTILQTALQPDMEERYGAAVEMEQALAQAIGLEAIVQARQALASIVQKLFEDERKLEAAETAPPPATGVVPGGNEGVVPGGFTEAGIETAVSGSGTVIAPHVPAPAPTRVNVENDAGVVPAAEPAKGATTPSGLTLARGGIPPPVVLTRGPAPGAGSPLRVYLIMGIAFVLAALAFGGMKLILKGPEPTDVVAPVHPVLP